MREGSSEGRPTEVHAGDLVLAPPKGWTRRWVISLHSGQGSTHAEFGAARVNSRSGVVRHGGPIRPCAANGTEESAEERHCWASRELAVPSHLLSKVWHNLSPIVFCKIAALADQDPATMIIIVMVIIIISINYQTLQFNQLKLLARYFMCAISFNPPQDPRGPGDYFNPHFSGREQQT